MTAELLPVPHASTNHLDGDPADGFLDGLARLYRFVLITDLSGQVRWMSQEFSQLCDDAEPHVGRDLTGLISRVTKREQALALRAELRERGYLAGAHLEISGRDGAPLSLELSVLPLSDRPDEAGLTAVIARPELPREPVVARARCAARVSKSRCSRARPTRSWWSMRRASCVTRIARSSA